jgi:hypothetical protein
MQLKLAHSLLATKFLRPKRPDYYRDFSERQVSDWTAALGETPEAAMKRLVEEGLLVQCADLAETELTGAFDSCCTVAQLYALLRARRLGAAGRKAELIQRLAKADLAAIRSILAEQDLVQCSASGRLLSQAWTARVSQLRTTVRAELEERRFEDAVAAGEQFDQELGFPRWEFQGRREAAHVHLIMHSSPAILSAVPLATLENFRISAAAYYICGANDIPQSDAPIEGCRLPNDTAVRMILFSASWRRNMAQLRSGGIQRVRHTAILADANTCEVCRQLHGCEWLLDEAPELPHQNCANVVLGCRCFYSAVF